MADRELKKILTQQTIQFGITISCYRGDLPLLNGCLESIHAHLGPKVPICLIAHGDFETRHLENTYGVKILREAEVDPRLRAHSYGYGLTKMVAFWHSPFERFLHIDADTVCWGNFLEGAPLDDYDFIYNEPHEVIDDRIQRSQYFDPDQVFENYPHFAWRGLPYFNAGVFAARRGMLDIDEYLQLRELQERRPSALLCGEQGILNLMVFRRIVSGEIRARQWPLQAVVPVIPEDELARRFSFSNGRPFIDPDHRRLIHWAGPKPYLTKNGPFRRPMNFYRLEHLKRIGSPMRHLGRNALILEELASRFAMARKGGVLSAAKAIGRQFARRLFGSA